VNIRISVQHI